MLTEIQSRRCPPNSSDAVGNKNNGDAEVGVLMAAVTDAQTCGLPSCRAVVEFAARFDSPRAFCPLPGLSQLRLFSRFIFL